MSDESAEKRIALRRKAIFSAVWRPLSILLLVWSLLVAHAFFGIDVIGLLEDREPSDLKTTLSATILLTAIGIWYAWRGARKAVGLFDYGVDVVGVVTGIGMLGDEFSAVLKYEYVYNGTKYAGSVDMGRDDATRRRDVGQVRLIVNPNEPSQSDVFESIFPS